MSSFRVFGILVVLLNNGSTNNVNPKTYIRNGNICSLCEPGTFVFRHCTDTTDSVCKPCPTGTFQTTYTQAERCAPCTSQCWHDINMMISEKCNATRDSKCECKQGYYLKHYKYHNIHICKEYTPCPSGHIITKKGTSISDTVCSQCPDGQFYDSIGQCDNCTSCSDRNMTVLLPCRAAVDAVCKDIGDPIVNDTISTPPNTIAVQPEDNADLIVASVVGVVLVIVIIIVFLYYYLRKHPTCNKDATEDDTASKYLLQRLAASESSLPAFEAKEKCKDNCIISPVPESLFPHLKDPDTWKQNVFTRLSYKLTDWKFFIRSLPANKNYRSSIDAEIQHIQTDHPSNSREQLYRALTYWSQVNETEYIIVDSILDTLKNLNYNELCDDIRTLCCAANDGQARDDL